MLTDIQKTCMEVIEIFENAHPFEYGQIVAIKGDSGGLSGGLLMASMRSGNLGKLLRAYRTAGGTMISEEEVQQTEAQDPSQNSDPVIRSMFKAAVQDPIMREVQDTFFYGMFLKPAEEWAAARGYQYPLTTLLIFDGIVHGHFFGTHGFGTTVPKSLPEKDWVKEYVAERKKWLAENINPVLRNCVYRMVFFEQMQALGNYGLVLPLVAHGFTLK